MNRHYTKEGYIALCEKLREATGAFIWCDCYPEGIVDPASLPEEFGYLMPLGLYMRPGWLDR